MIARAWLLVVLPLFFSGRSAVSGDAPPGTVAVKGGHTHIGSTVADIEKLVLAREELRLAVAGETPQFTTDVADFFLMPTEVTNEQYAEFVRATGAKPPRSWAAHALQLGQVAFLEEQGRAKQAAKAASARFEPKVFDPEAWWEEHWHETQWEIPSAENTYPVVFVSYPEAQHYARWAGLRLMSEFEFQRAARGDSDRTYPWGNEWDDKRFCSSLHSGKDLCAAAATFAPGAVGGIFDLAGNVWEWTSSPFTPFPGYQALRFVAKGNRAIDCLAPFDPDQLVTVGGSFQTDKIGVRVATRRNTDPTQSTNALGFRCAASTTPGLDAARWILDQDLNTKLVSTADFEPDAVAALQRWESIPGSVQVPGYAVIRAHEHVLGCPRRELAPPSPGELARLTVKSGPQFIALVNVPRPLLAPELAAGSYLVAWHAAATGPGHSAEQGHTTEQGMYLGAQDAPTPLRALRGYAADKDQYIFYSLDGNPRAVLSAPPVTAAKPHAGSVHLEPAGADPKADAKTPAGDTLRFTFVIASTSSRGKAFVFDLPLVLAAGALDASWK